MSDTPQGATAPEVILYSTAICPYCVAAKNFLLLKQCSFACYQILFILRTWCNHRRICKAEIICIVFRIVHAPDHVGRFIKLQKLLFQGFSVLNYKLGKTVLSF